MIGEFTKNIAPHVQAELESAKQERVNGDHEAEFHHLENAHVIGQESTLWHVRVHWQMLLWAIRNSKVKEFLGQLIRVFGAATKTAIGLVPMGNTGGTNVSPFKVMPINPEHQSIINKSKAGA